MKKCPRCGKTYDDSWGVCLADDEKLIQIDPEVAEENKIKAQQKTEEERYLNEHWEEELQEEMSKNLGITKEELVKKLKAMTYPKWLYACAIILVFLVAISAFQSIRYFKGAILLQKFDNSKQTVYSLDYLNSALKTVPDSGKAWKELIYFAYTYGEEDIIADKTNNLPFTTEGKEEIWEEVKQIVQDRNSAKKPAYGPAKKEYVRQKLMEIIS